MKFRPHAHTLSIIRTVSLALALSVAACSSPRERRPVPAVPAIPAHESAEDALFILHNHQRSFHGAAPLQRDAELSDYARNWAETMARSGSMKHSSLRFVGSGYSAGAENVAMMQKSPSEVMNAWMQSSGHRKNVLNDRYTHAGFGVAYDESGRPYWCAVFGG
ncbi:MAG: hypothetical protein RL088_3322 [Verrucomicrobiota bacterium]|jgi:uncharacterized protein YkwD